MIPILYFVVINTIRIVDFHYLLIFMSNCFFIFILIYIYYYFFFKKHTHAIFSFYLSTGENDLYIL